MNSTLDNSQLNVFSAFVQLLNWKQVTSIVDDQPEEGTTAAAITLRNGSTILGFESRGFVDSSKNQYRVFDIRSAGQTAFVKTANGVDYVAVATNKQMNDFFAFAETLDSDDC